MGNFLLPIGASVITKLGQLRFVTNWGKCCYKLGQVLLQIGASVITNWVQFFIANWGSLIITNQGRFYYKSGQLLQIEATVITNWGITTVPSIPSHGDFP